MDEYFEFSIGKLNYQLKTGNQILIDEIKDEFYFSKPEKINKNFLDFDNFFKKFKHKLDSRNPKNFPISKTLGFICTGIIETLTIEDGIILLHGSSCVINNKGYVFIGPSGYGKSTIIKKAAIKDMLSDDTAIIKNIDNKWYLFSSVFDKKKVKLSKQKYPIKEIYVIKKSKAEKLEKIDIIIKIKELFKNDLLLMNKDNFKHSEYIDQSSKQAARLLFKLINDVPIRRLSFKKDTNVNDLLR